MFRGQQKKHACVRPSFVKLAGGMKVPRTKPEGHGAARPILKHPSQCRKRLSQREPVRQKSENPEIIFFSDAVQKIFKRNGRIRKYERFTVFNILEKRFGSVFGRLHVRLVKGIDL